MSMSMRERLRTNEFRNETIALVALLLLIQLFPRKPLLGVYVLGLSAAAPLALHATGIVLVYRANRFINFAQVQLAVATGVLFTALVQGQFLLNVARSACGCIDREPGAPARTINFALAAVLATGVAALVGWAFYVTILRRFRRSPRIILTLVTIFAAQALAGMQGSIQQFLVPDYRDNPDAFNRIAGRSTRPPGDFTWRVDKLASLTLGDMILIAAAIAGIVGVALYLRRSDTGIAIRSASESPARAATLGVDVVGVTSRVWVLTGLLAGLAGVVGAFGAAVQQDPNQLTIPVDQLVLILAVAVIARFRNLGMVAAGAVVLAVLRIAVQFSFSSTTPFDAAAVFLVGGLLLLQRQRGRARASRAEREEGYEVAEEVRPIPGELRHLPQVRTWVRTVSTVVAVILLGVPWALSSSSTTLLTVFVIYSIIGLSLVVLTGWAGQVSLGQFGFAAIGAWAAAASGLPFPFALLLGGLAGAAAALLVGIPALRLRGLNLALSTLALAVSASALFIDERYLGRFLPKQLGRPSILGMDLDDARVFYYFALVMVAVCAAAVVGLRRSRTGRILIAVRANEAAAQSFGVSPLRANLTAFAVAGFLAAFAGALFAFHQREVAPQSFTPDVSLQIFMFSVIGGLGGLVGPFLGFGFFAVLELLSDNPLLQYTAGGTGALLLLFIAPGGLAQLVYGARDSALRRLAVRLRIPVPSLMGDRKAGQLLDRAGLDDKRGRDLRADSSSSLLYKLPRQWALDRYGRDDVKERVGG
jgi:branched-chain amino acid transport system permease protein